MGAMNTQQEQNEEDNLERRGRGGGCAAPCSMEVWPTTSTPLHHHTKAKKHFRKNDKFNYNRKQTDIRFPHNWMTDLPSQRVEKCSVP